MSTFDATLVPIGTLKSMAKRMKKHPQAAHLSLSECQEVLAKTFGHASWHAAQHFQRPDQTQEALNNPADRALLYKHIGMSQKAGVPAMTHLERLLEAFALARRWPLYDLINSLLADAMENEGNVIQALGKRLRPIAPIESFLVRHDIEKAEQEALGQAHQSEIENLRAEETP